MRLEWGLPWKVPKEDTMETGAEQELVIVGEMWQMILEQIQNHTKPLRVRIEDLERRVATLERGQRP
jgi:hypothetical protein